MGQRGGRAPPHIGAGKSSAPGGDCWAWMGGEGRRKDGRDDAFRTCFLFLGSVSWTGGACHRGAGRATAIGPGDAGTATLIGRGDAALLALAVGAGRDGAGK